MLELTDTQIGTWVATFILPLFGDGGADDHADVRYRMVPARVRLYGGGDHRGDRAGLAADA
jgi:flagellar biosynthetic protein FliR